MPLPNPGMTFVPFDPLPASDLNDMVENIEALAAGTGLNDDSITAGKIVGIDKSNLTTDSNPYKFSVYRNSAANTGASAMVKVVFDTEEFDTNNNFSSGTYTVPVSGFYQFNWMVGVSIGAASTDTVAVLFKNGVEHKWGNEIEGQGGTGGNDIVACTAGDTIETYIYASSTSALLTGNRKYTYFSGYLISRT